MGKYISRLLLIVLVSASASFADPIVSGVTFQTTPLTNMTTGVANPTSINILFQEFTGTLSGNLAVDATDAGTYPPGSTGSFQIASGTAVATYFLHTDPPNTTTTRFQGSATFDTAILGVEVLGGTLAQGDGIVGLASVTYNADGNRGFELGSPADLQDTFTISADGHTVSWDATSDSAVDDMRIVTAGAVSTVSEPGSLVLLGTGLLSGIGMLRRR